MTDQLLTSIAASFGTPTYVYDLDLVAAQVQRLQAVFPAADLRYAVKANGNGALLRHLVGLGVGAEALTAGELARAVRAGFAPERLLLGGPGHTPELVERAAEVGVGLISLDGEGAYELWRDRARDDQRFLIRVNPAFDPQTHEHLATAAAHSKFGIDAAAAARLAERVKADGKLAGFHVHAGSMISDPAVAKLVVESLTPLYRRFPDLELVDFGGGFAVPDAPLAEFAAHYQRFCEEFGVTALLEPGRFIVADAGVLLTRVLHLKEGARRHLIADAGMADLLRPALYGAAHPVRLVAEDGRGRYGSAPTDVDGPLCENADRLARTVELPVVLPGDLLAVEQAGAYGFVMASNYASSLRPAEVVVEGGEARLARRREALSDLWRLEVDA